MFALETMLYAVGTAFIVLLMVKDNDVDVYRNAASTDHLTGLLNRRAFLESALNLCARQAKRGEPVTMLMFDLDHFKSINDRFGHAVGDEVLRVFAQRGALEHARQRHHRPAWRRGIRRYRGRSRCEFAERIAERLRASFEAAGVTIADHAIGATVSIGAATAYRPVTDIAPLIARADAALYRAKHDGRNRLHGADESRRASRPA